VLATFFQHDGECDLAIQFLPEVFRIDHRLIVAHDGVDILEACGMEKLPGGNGRSKSNFVG
jgi:hypothetical protein